MYLMDAITSLAAAIHPDDSDDNPFREAIPDLAARMKHAPRYLLDRRATEAMVELSLGRPKVLLEALAHVRAPYPTMWVEWDDADRQRLRDQWDKLGEPMSYAELRPMPGRVGFLLQSDPGGRSGTAIWSWMTPAAQHFPNVGPIRPHWDLDRRFELSADRLEALLGGNIGKMWADNPVQLNAFLDLWRTAEHRPCSWAPRYFGALGNDPVVIALSYADVVGEYITIWAILLLLTASRPTVEYQPIDRTKLNKARLRRHDTPLLDHTAVTMHIDRHRVSAAQRAPLGYTRKSPRVHLVSRYLARRGDKHWLVEPYLRGQGRSVERHVNVKS